MASKFGHGSGRDGKVTFQQIQRQFADGVDLIGVGVLQEGLSLASVGLAQDAFQKRALSPKSFHANNDETSLAFTPFYYLIDLQVVF